MRWAALAVILVTALVWSSALGAGFVFDDNLFWLRAPCWQISAWADLPHVPSSPGCGYRKLRYLSLAVDHLIWRDQPLGYHLTNVLLHLGVTAGVWVLASRWTDRRWLAGLCTLVWALHPVHTDVVTYVAGRRDLLAALFFVASLVLWPRHEQGVRRAWRIATSLSAFALAVLSKEMAVTAPVALALLLWGDDSGRSFVEHWRALDRRRIVALVPAVVIGGAIAAWTVLQRGILHPLTDTSALHGPSLGAHVGSVLAAYGRYAELLAAPLRLYGDYSDFRVAGGLMEWRNLPGTLLLLGVWVGGAWLAVSAPYRRIGVGLLFFGVTMLPVSQIIPHHELLAEHYLYIPSIGLALAATSLMDAALSRRPQLQTPILAVCCTLLVAFSVRIQFRNAEFADENTFAAAIVRHVPHSFRGRRSLANGLARAGQLPEAAALLEQMQRDFRPGGNEHAAIAGDLAQVMAATGDLQRAESLALLSLQTLADNDEASATLGSIYLQTDRPAMALAPLESSLRDHPNITQRRVWLAMALAQTGAVDEALQELQIGAGFAPADPLVPMAAGDILASVGRLRMAAIMEALGDEEGAARLRSQVAGSPRGQ